MQFEIALSNVLLTLFYIVPGYVICKMKKASADHLSTISSILIYGCAPCLIISSFLKLDFSVTDVGKMGLFFLITLVSSAAPVSRYPHIAGKQFITAWRDGRSKTSFPSWIRTNTVSLPTNRRKVYE